MLETERDAHAPQAASFDVGLGIQYKTWRFAEMIVRARAARGLSAAAQALPIYRELRWAVRAKLTALFDDLAAQSGLAAHRLDEGALVLDSPGLFIYASGAWKGSYSSFTAEVWAESVARAEEIGGAFGSIIGARRIREPMFVINWQFSTGNGLDDASFEEIADDCLLDEAYPMLGEPVARFVERYLAAPETVLVLQGAPGTGKTRLVRAILAGLSARKGSSAAVMYTADRRALEKDEVFVKFITGSHDAFVIEDADHLLLARSNGNIDLHRFLAVADGVVRAQGRKMIFTTNLPNLSDIDAALLRPGRCFASVRVRALQRDEVERLVAKLCADDANRCATALERLFADGARSIPLANVYRACA
jgi:ATPase family associated with various cellular activities (AAA)